MRSIKSKITLFIILLIILTVITVTYFNILSSLKFFEEKSKFQLESLASENSLKLESKMTNEELQLESIKKYLEFSINSEEYFKDDNDEYIETILIEIEPFMKKVSDSIEDNILIYIVFTNDYTKNIHQLILGENYDGTYSVIDDLVDYNDLLQEKDNMVWYFSPLKTKEGTWTGPYDDPYINEKLITYSAPVIVDDKIVAVVGTDIEFDVFSRIVSDVKVYDTGYAFLLNEKYEFIVHPTIDEHESLESLDDGIYSYMIPIIKSKDVGSILYEFKVKKMMGFSRLKNGWILAVAPPLSEVYATLYEVQFRMILSALILISILTTISLKISTFITKPIITLTSYVDTIGDTKSKIPLPEEIIKNKTEIGYLGTAISKMNENLFKAYDNLEKSNQYLDKKVKDKTSELLQSNLELKRTIITLEDMQTQIAQSEKDKALRKLIQYLTHRFNTPIGNTITSSSFLLGSIENCEKSPKKDSIFYKECKQGLDIIFNSQKQLSEIVDSLSFLLMKFDDESKSPINLHKLIKSALDNFSNDTTHKKLNISLICDENLIINSYKFLIDSLIKYLLLYSCNIRSNTDNVDLKILIVEESGHIMIRYTDSKLTNYNTDIFNPFSSEFNSITSSIELIIVHDIVNRGLDGTIEYDYDGLSIRLKK